MTFDSESAPDGASPARRIADSESPVAAGTARRVVDERTFSSAVGWTVLGTLIPGLGLWRSGRRVLGGLIMGAILVAIGGLAALYVTNQRMVQQAVITPDVLKGAAIGLLILAALWVTVIGLTHLALRPANPSLGQRTAGAAVVGALAFVVAAPMAMGSNLVWTTAGALGSDIFSQDETPNATQPTLDAVDPWKNKPRLNFLILGGDSGNDRSSTLGDRTDTVIVASVDTHTGATTLITLPRNAAHMPFPTDSPLHKYFPNGFYDGVNSANAEYLLNAMYRNIPHQVPKDVLGKTSDLGADVLKVSVGEALGLDIDYYVLVNMDGFKDFINAIGGVNLNINYRIPIGGQTDAGIPPEGYLEPAKNKHLNGRLALWYARGRYGLDDYKRMERQRCVINAVVQQTTPQNVLSNYQAIAKAGESTIRTDVPRKLLPDLLTVATKVKGTKLRSVVFTPGTAGFASSNPNWDKVRARVKKALKETESGVKTTPTASTSSTATSSASPTTKTSSTAEAKSDDLDSICGYHPE